MNAVKTIIAAKPIIKKTGEALIKVCNWLYKKKREADKKRHREKILKLKDKQEYIWHRLRNSQFVKLDKIARQINKEKQKLRELENESDNGSVEQEN